MKRSITRKVSNWKPGESTEPLPLNVSDGLIESVLDVVQEALQREGIDLVVLGAEIQLHAVQRIARKASPVDAGRAKPAGAPKMAAGLKTPQKHTCGKDGDPGASAPLDGRCQKCMDDNFADSIQ